MGPVFVTASFWLFGLSTSASPSTASAFETDYLSHRQRHFSRQPGENKSHNDPAGFALPDLTLLTVRLFGPDTVSFTPVVRAYPLYLTWQPLIASPLPAVPGHNSKPSPVLPFLPSCNVVHNIARTFSLSASVMCRYC